MMENHFKKIALTTIAAGTIATAAGQETLPQKMQGVDSMTHKTMPTKENSVVTPTDSVTYTDFLRPTIDTLAVYNKHKELYDDRFSMEGSLNDMKDAKGVIPDTVSVLFAYHGLDHATVKVKQKDAQGNLLSREEFTDLYSLGIKYPAYKLLAEQKRQELYQRYVEQTAWEVTNSEEEAALSNNFENYQPSVEELAIMKQCVEDRKAGKNNDGGDLIYNYYMSTIKTPADLYAFYKKYNGTPTNLAKYMQLTYFIPFVEEK